MKDITYKATQESEISNLIVKDLNATVLRLTFPSEGIHLADLYRSKHSADCLVGHGTCPPINGEFVRTVTIEIV